jgi:hypothetical protein
VFVLNLRRREADAFAATRDFHPPRGFSWILPPI